MDTGRIEMENMTVEEVAKLLDGKTVEEIERICDPSKGSLPRDVVVAFVQDGSSEADSVQGSDLLTG